MRQDIPDHHRLLDAGDNPHRPAADLTSLNIDPEHALETLRLVMGDRRAAGVSFEDRQDLLGHKSGRITTHYSVAELQNLIEAANRVRARKVP